MILAFLGITGYNYHKNYKNDLQKIKEELEQAYQRKVEELTQKNSKSLNSSLEIKENQWNQKFLLLNYDFLTYKFDKEKDNDRVKLSLSLKILNVLSEGNWNYMDGTFKKYFIFIEDCCKKQTYFDHSEFDDVTGMLSKLPDRFEKEKKKLESVINYE